MSCAATDPDLHDRLSTATHFEDADRGGALRSAGAVAPGARRLDPGRWRVAWTEIARTALTSRAIDQIEEKELLPGGKLRNQFSARGHELLQSVVAWHLRHPHDAAMGYYRSRPFLLGAGLSAREAFATSLGRATGRTRGRDVGVVLNLPARRGVTVLPTSGDVGGQYTPAAGWAQAIVYHAAELSDAAWEGAIAVAMGGDASVATGGFWSALTIATTLALPMLFVVEDNGIGISTPSHMQTPGGNIAQNLEAFGNLRIFDGRGDEPEACFRLVEGGVTHVRRERRPALVRARVPRLCGHSGMESRPPRTDGLHDPLALLSAFLEESGLFDAGAWADLEGSVECEVRHALEEALADPAPDPTEVARHVFAAPRGHAAERADEAPGEGAPVMLKHAVRLTLEHELRRDARLVVLGEDVGEKGGVHGVTAGLHEAFGGARVVDTSLSEEGIIGRSVGMALAGLRPVPEIQFRKYLDAATEQVNNCGTLRWRTAGEFSAPIVVRVPVGYHARVSDPWHAASGEAVLAHAPGWRVAFPSNARDAAGLLREALRGDDPTFFLEHRNLLASARASAPYPGPDHTLPFGRARVVLAGARATVVTWGDMLYRALDAAARVGDGAVEVVDLRTIAPWDREAVLSSVKKTGRCLVLHEDTITAGFGAEIAAVVAKEAFLQLEAPVDRMAPPDCPLAYERGLLDAALPGVDDIALRLGALLEY